MSGSPATDDLVIVGRIRKAHGLHGELLIEALTGEPDAVFAPGRRVFAGNAVGEVPPSRPVLTVSELRRHGPALRIRFEEIPDRTVADRWRERYLLVPAEELTPLAPGEVYIHELEGMQVELVSGEPVGSVMAVFELPQGLGLEVKREAGTVVIPYDRVVAGVDRERRLILIDPPAGLLD